MTNNLVWSDKPIWLTEGGGQKVVLQRNTVCLEGGRVGLSSLIVATKTMSPATVEAEGNAVFFNNCRFGRGLPVLGDDPWKDWKDRVRWHGSNNLYVNLGSIHPPEYEDKLGPQFSGLDGWNARLEEPETGSKAVEWTPQSPGLLAWDEVRQVGDAALLAVIEREVAAERRRTGLFDLGPERFDQIGPGDAYLRTLPDATKERPEAAEGGPVTLLRQDKVAAAFPTLAAAFAKAQSDDVIELRTDRTLEGGPTRLGTGRLTIRAAPGYQPTVKQLDVSEGTELAMEGLTISILFNRGGVSLHIANCAIPVDGRIELSPSDGQQPAQVLNCLILGDWNATGRFAVRNSVMSTFVVTQGKKGEIDFDRCVVWYPWNRRNNVGEPFGVTRFVDKPAELTVRRCLIESRPGLLNLDGSSHTTTRWQGERNVYRIGSPNWFIQHASAGTLDAWRKRFNSPETGSVAGQPWLLDPRKWAFLPGTAGHRQGPDGTDFGADTERIATP
jgi:hypothetical protein